MLKKFSLNEEENTFNSLEFHTDKIFENMMSEIFIEEVMNDSQLKWMIIVTFNTQCAVMRWMIFFMIHTKKIKNRTEYKDLCDNTVTKENIIYLSE